MNWTHKVRQQLRDLGFRENIRDEIDAMGVQLTICQLIVVCLSFMSVVFLFVPFLFLTDWKFILIFVSASLLLLGISIWFWVKRAEICENPGEVQEELDNE